MTFFLQPVSRSNSASTIFFIFIFIVLTFSCSTVLASEQYDYVLEQSLNDEMCDHMTGVFNKKFKTPWDLGHFNNVDQNPQIFGIPLDKIFERQPEVPFEGSYSRLMLLSKFPSADEFDTIRWKESRYKSKSIFSKDEILSPILITELDLYHDGEKEWLVKFAFMTAIPQYEGWIRVGLGDADALAIFPPNGFDPMRFPTHDEIWDGEVKDLKPKVVDRFQAVQVRPFIYKNLVFMAAYKQIWPENVDGDLYQQNPQKEYMNVLQVLPGGKKFNSDAIEAANTKIICQIEMIMH